MPNGKIGDNPLTDMLIHGEHPFPADVEDMLRKLHALNPKLLHGFDMEPFDWQRGKNLKEGRELLKGMLARHAGSVE